MMIDLLKRFLMISGGVFVLRINKALLPLAHGRALGMVRLGLTVLPL
jgi:hypothetical protein